MFQFYSGGGGGGGGVWWLWFLTEYTQKQMGSFIYSNTFLFNHIRLKLVSIEFFK